MIQLAAGLAMTMAMMLRRAQPRLSVLAATRPLPRFLVPG